MDSDVIQRCLDSHFSFFVYSLFILWNTKWMSLYYLQYCTIVPSVLSFETEVSFAFLYIQCSVVNHYLESCHALHVLDSWTDYETCSLSSTRLTSFWYKFSLTLGLCNKQSDRQAKHAAEHTAECPTLHRHFLLRSSGLKVRHAQVTLRRVE